jgi:hypothetical protein
LDFPVALTEWIFEGFSNIPKKKVSFLLCGRPGLGGAPKPKS